MEGDLSTLFVTFTIRGVTLRDGRWMMFDGRWEMKRHENSNYQNTNSRQTPNIKSKQDAWNFEF